MKTYLKILKYIPIKQFAGKYFIFAFLSSIFNIFTFGLIQNLLDVLFGNSSKTTTVGNQDSWSNLPNILIANFEALHGKIGTLWLVCGIIVTCVIIGNIFRYLSARIIETVKAGTVYNIRKSIFDKAISLDLGFFTEQRKGDLLSKLTTDVQEVENSIGKAFSAVFKDFILIILYFVFLFYKSWQLTLFSIIIIPLSGYLIGILTKKLKEKATIVQENQSKLLSMLEEVFGGMRAIKGFGAENFISNKFDQANNDYKKSFLKMVYRQEASPPISEVLGVVLVTTIMIFGGTLVLSGQSDMTASAFVAYIVIYSQVTRPAKDISNALAGTQRGIAATERILTVLESTENKAVNTGLNFNALERAIVFENVNFEYTNGKKVLQNINLIIEKGKTTALVGSSGGGKSTLADLIPRFYETTSGQIFVDNNEIKSLKLSDLRAKIGIVSQDNILFNDTIFNNVAFGQTQDQEAVIEACKIANAHQFIIQHAHGYQRNIGDRGLKLSGGQRQRLAIARAILKNPSILILDEATSALDNESEKLVQVAIANMMTNRTCIVIAHRLSTIVKADKIVVLQKGEIVEQGTHLELMNIENGFYKKLNQIQG